MRIEDFERFLGHEAKLETAAMVDNRRRWRGVIKAVSGDDITIVGDHGEASVKFSALSDARLVLTDKLIEEDLKRARAAEAAEENTDEGKAP
jgi:ribosome maturation factor RimP